MAIDTSRHNRADYLRRSTISALTIEEFNSLEFDLDDDFDLDNYENDENDIEQHIMNLPSHHNSSSCRWSNTERAKEENSPVVAQRKPSISMRWNDSSKFSDESPRPTSRRLSMEHNAMLRKVVQKNRKMDEIPSAAIRRLSVDTSRMSLHGNCKKQAKQGRELASPVADATAADRWQS